MIPVYTPGIQVLVTRLVQRVNGAPVTASSGFKQIDLTGFLGQQGGVRTMKDIHQPAGGFSITFSDRMHPTFGDSVYSLCEPMDLVEIRASRSPEKYAGGPLPLIMRGFISLVERHETMSAEGTPQRSVTISGQDMGKLFLTHHIYLQVAIAEENDYLTTFHLFTSLGIDVGVLPVSEYMTQLVQNVVNKKIDKMNVFSDAQVKPFIVDATVPDGAVLPQIAVSFDQVPIWQLVSTFADQPYNEVFIRDLEDGPHFIFRPAPYRSLEDQSYIMNGATDPGTFTSDIRDVVSLSVLRTDARVANFFWVDPGASQIDTNGYLSTAALQAGWPLDFAHPNNAPELFGVRKMQTATNLQPQSISAPVNKLPPGQQAQATNDYKQWFAQRAMQLKAMNRDNSAFEEGGAVLKGSEDIIVGIYWELTRGNVTSDAYITQVSHNYAPLGTWTTSIRVIRGTGFNSRNQSGSVSPYIGEGFRGPYQ